MMLGSFEINVHQRNDIDSDIQSIFDEATNVRGVRSRLMLYLGKQIVHGENHAYIARSERAVHKPKAYYELIIINANYDGGERKTCIVRRETILKTSSSPIGGIACSTYDEASIKIINSAEANNLISLFKKGMHNFLGLDYDPELYLGRQTVKGFDYFYIVEATSIREKTKSVKLVVINDFMNKAKVVEIKDILN